jgi:hypothetical protein
MQCRRLAPLTTHERERETEAVPKPRLKRSVVNQRLGRTQTNPAPLNRTKPLDPPGER